MDNLLTPRQIVQELDKYIVGQHDAKKNVAIALRNRWRRMHTDDEIKKEIIPNNILMIGPTGVGKTEIARRLAKLADAPFVKVEASKFTEVGYVGRDVEGMVRDLAEQAVNMVKLQRKEIVKQKAADAVEQALLDLLIPPIHQPEKKKTKIHVNGIEVPTFESATDPTTLSDIELNQKTREKFLIKLRNGELEDKKVEIEVSQPAANVGILGPQGIDEQAMQGLQDMLQGMVPKKSKKRKIPVSEARKILLEEEMTKLIDMEDVKSEALAKAENSGIIFIDEIDKIARSGGKGSGADVSREGVQRDLLPIVEGSAVNTRYGVLNTDHILFIAAGAFHVSKPADLIPELQGRFPIRVELQSLTKDDFVQILKTPKNSLTKQYIAMLKAEGVHLSFEDSAIERISEIAAHVNAQVENIGARRLHTVMSTLLNTFMYDIPDVLGAGNTIVINDKLVDEKLNNLVKDKDLSRYIL
ncbi:MAG: ATP-dependent protease ATPase subunit HslU [Cytophagales bacterium]|nr:ATP-dependent protease ATPase subunit HslU [Cytophagales bacterium]